MHATIPTDSFYFLPSPSFTLALFYLSAINSASTHLPASNSESDFDDDINGDEDIDDENM